MYGRDACLLDTRHLVLEKAGFTVYLAHSAAEARNMIVSESPALFILCHSLKLEECEHMLVASHQLRPEMIHMVLTAFQPSCPEELAEQVLNIHNGPKSLISAVTKVFHQLEKSLGDDAPALLRPS